MEKFLITGGVPLTGNVTLSGAKNVSLKLCVASLLTKDELIFHNVPLIGDVFAMTDILTHLGVRARINGHSLHIQSSQGIKTDVSLELGARLRTSSMILGPLLARFGRATIPNPGGCRIGARPIDRHIEGLRQMGADIVYNSDDGFFHAKAKALHGIDYTFEKNTHTGTETLMLAAALARGTTTLRNVAQEVEVDDLIACLNLMGAHISRTKPREIVIEGVSALHGAEYSIMPDRNEEVTFAVGAIVTGGDITVTNSMPEALGAFYEALEKTGAGVTYLDTHTTRYFSKGNLQSTDMVTGQYPGFMTDWQAPWAILMTQAKGISTIHETVFESRFSYVSELKKMGAGIDFFDPKVSNPEAFYNFNWADRIEGYHQGIRIHGPTKLHNAILTMDDLRAGATLVIAALVAKGESYIDGVEQIDRGYEKIEERLTALGAHIKRIKNEV